MACMTKFSRREDGREFMIYDLRIGPRAAPQPCANRQSYIVNRKDAGSDLLLQSRLTASRGLSWSPRLEIARFARQPFPAAGWGDCPVARFVGLKSLSNRQA